MNAKPIKISNSVKIEDPNMLMFKEKAEDLIRLSITQALIAKDKPSVSRYVSSSHTFKKGGKEIVLKSTADTVADYVSSLPLLQKNSLFKRIASENLLPDRQKSIAATHKVDMKSTKPVLEQVDLAKVFSFVNNETFTQQTVNKVLENFGWIQILPDRPAPKPIKEINFQLHSVKCVDETGLQELLGDDEIAISGVSINDKGEEQIISQFNVGKNFKDGVTATFNPPRVLRKFIVDEDYTEPKTFLTTLFMAEIDRGGFGEFINEAFEAIKNDLQVILVSLGAAAGAFVGSQIGGTVGTAVSGPLGTIIGILAGLIVGALVSLITSALQDDVFTPTDDHKSLLIIPEATANFNGSDTSPVQSMVFRDHNGIYKASFNYAIVR